MGSFHACDALNVAFTCTTAAAAATAAVSAALAVAVTIAIRQHVDKAHSKVSAALLSASSFSSARISPCPPNCLLTKPLPHLPARPQCGDHHITHVPNGSLWDVPCDCHHPAKGSNWHWKTESKRHWKGDACKCELGLLQAGQGWVGAALVANGPANPECTGPVGSIAWSLGRLATATGGSELHCAACLAHAPA